MKKGTKDFFRLIAIFVGLAAFGFFLIAAATCTTKPKFEKNVDSVEWLPKTASNISYLERSGLGGVKFAEFSISQSDFVIFCRENSWELIEKENVSIFRRNYITDQQPIPERPFHENQVKKALYYEDIGSNGGGITLVYDLEAKRGYYFYSHN